jgi:hypothetical protein
MRIFRVTFHNQGKIYQLYAEVVAQADLFGFVELKKLIFGENTTLVIDPGEEKLKDEFSGVTRTLVPLQAIIRIDEVEKRGQSKIFEIDANANVTPFPSPLFTPPGK